MTDISIRKMVVDDIEYVMGIDSESFTSSWTEEIFHLEIVENIHAHYFVLELEGMIIGYAGMWVVIDDAQVTNIAILPRFRGFKFGEKLFGFLFHTAVQMGAVRLSLEVRLSNTVAQKMYRRFGLVPGGIRKNYYTDNREDAMIMWVNL